jgi:ABC-type molybdate transport system ATPase subunit
MRRTNSRGGEARRVTIGKLVLAMPNVMLPTWNRSSR